jgi:hypothetical protein
MHFYNLKLYFLLASFFVSVLLLTSFQVTLAQTPKEAIVRTYTELPELPSRHEIYPDIWDENDCLIDSNQTSRLPTCEASPTESKSEKNKRLNTSSLTELNKEKRLLGFEGLYFTPLLTENAVVVLVGTVTALASADGSFSAVGLIRNEIAGQLINSATVVAELMNSSGKVIDKASAEALVAPLRPGEPAPFELKTKTPFKDGAKVNWHVEWAIESDTAKISYREVEIGALMHGPQYWGQRKAGPTQWDSPGQPYPYIEEGTVENLSEKNIPNPEIVLAWYETNGAVSGKIIAVETLPLYQPVEDKLVPAKVLTGKSPTKPAEGSLLSYAIKIKDRAFAQRVEKWELKKIVWVTGGE